LVCHPSWQIEQVNLLWGQDALKGLPVLV
jgi:hypothetical protein